MKYKIIFFILFFVQSFYAQNIKEWNVGVEGILTTKGVFSYPRIGFKLNKIHIQTGMLVGKEYVHSKTVLGGQIDFILFPVKNNKNPFNLFFVGSINYFRNKISLTQSQVKTHFIQATLGYGFKYYLSKSFFFKTNMGLGVILENRNFSFDSKDPTNKWGASGIISFGIAYRL